MSNRPKRGVAQCKKIFTDPTKFTIEFNEKGVAIGENASLFKSWIGIEFRKRIPYHQVANEIDKKLYDNVWEYIKVLHIFYSQLHMLYLLLLYV